MTKWKRLRKLKEKKRFEAEVLRPKAEKIMVKGEKYKDLEEKYRLEHFKRMSGNVADIISKTKLSRVELLKINNELQKKTEGNAKIAEEYKKQNLLTEEISNSKKIGRAHV